MTADATAFDSDAFRRTRRALGLTQQGLTEELVAAGVTMTRGHLANLEAGNSNIQPGQWEGLRRVAARRGLDVNGDVSIPCGDARDIDLGREIRAAIVENEVPPRPLRGQSLHPERSERAGATTLNGRAAIEDLLVTRLDGIASRTPPRVHNSIDIVGFVDVRLESGHVGLSRVVRDALRRALQAGWHVRHLAFSPESGDESALARAFFPLLRCPRFDAYVAPRAIVASIGNLVLAPGLAVTCFPDSKDDVVSWAAVQDERVEEMYRTLVNQTVRNSSSFVTRTDRTQPSEDASVTPGEEAFRGCLSEVSRQPGQHRLMLGWFPNSLVEETAYARLIDARRRAALPPVDEHVWNEFVSQQRARRDALMMQIRSGTRHRTVVTSKNLEAFVECGTHHGRAAADWRKHRPSDRRAMLQQLVMLLDVAPNFEIGIAGPDSAIVTAVDEARWEVRDGDKGVVLIQAHYEDGFAEPHHRQVDLRIDRAQVVRAFSAYFDDLWNSPHHVTTDRRAVKAQLQDLASRVP